MAYDPELERFKQEIDLRDYAAAQGYAIISKTDIYTVMRHPVTNNKINVRQKGGNWVYASTYDDEDNGTIIDFIQNHKGGKLGEIRRELREWLGSPSLLKPEKYVSRAEKSSKDHTSILHLAATLPPVEEQAYLKTRSVGNKDLLGHPRFAGRIHHDPKHGAACFFYEDGQGVCGIEMRNQGFKGFAPGSEKGIWRSNCYKEDKNLVFTEGVINALSYYVLHPNYQIYTRYMALGGAWGEKTRLLMESAAKKHPGNTIVLAFDNDTQGKKFAEDAQQIIAKAGKEIKTHFPENPGIDWNKQLTDALELEQQKPKNTHQDRLEKPPNAGYKVR